MLKEELLEIISMGEDSFHQFKANMTNADSMAAELVAFANSCGGWLLLGVNDDGSLSGLNSKDVARLNQMLSNVCSQHIRPAISPISQNFIFDEGIVIVVKVEEGISKPYMDSQGLFWTKNGADKRKITAREELQRMFQQAMLVHADELPVKGSSVNDIDLAYFEQFFESVYQEPINIQHTSITTLMENMNVMKKGELNVCGSLLFAKRPQIYLPMFGVKAVAFPSNDITEQCYLDSQEISGKLIDLYRQSLRFVLSNIHHRQNGQSVNSVGEPEIPVIVLEELIANALIHRDYFISAPIRILVFKNRVEIISPGHLPNNLTIENIKRGNSNIRNPILASFAARALPYRGLGSGILRALQHYPDIEFFDDRERNIFKVVVWRK